MDKQKCKYCDGHGNALVGDGGEVGPCETCTEPALYAAWYEARERHYENCAGAHGLPPGFP
jgi:hypothetical protein